MKKRVCTAAVCAAFSLSAFAQSALDQARTSAGTAAIDRAQSTGFLAGLERAMKTPLEIVWLRASAEESLWNDPSLSRTAAVGRTAWRYVFGGNAQFAPRPNEVARLVVSTLNLPPAPINAGRLDLTGTGRLYLVTPQAPGSTPPERLAMILAAGSTLYVSDAASPSIHIELKAPEDRPLLLGNLAASDIGKALSLLVKRGSADALEASIDEGGKVALHGGGEVQLAALLPNADLDDSPLAGTVTAALESPAKESGLEPTVVASLAQPGGLDAPPPAMQSEPIAIDLQFDMGEVASAIEQPSLTENDLVASIASIAAPVALAREEQAIVASAATPEPVRLEPKVDSSAALSVAASSAEALPPKVERTQLAALSPAAGGLEFKASSASEAASPEPKSSVAPDLARMRAEVEAEIAREQQRLAAQFKPQVIGAPAPKRFVLGV